MRTLLCEPTAVQHADAVRSPHGGEPVGDHKARAVLAQPFERLLHQPLGGVVERGCRLV
jgi:hypothetical protein